jgi:hypothetical protein
VVILKKGFVPVEVLQEEEFVVTQELICVQFRPLFVFIY